MDCPIGMQPSNLRLVCLQGLGVCPTQPPAVGKTIRSLGLAVPHIHPSMTKDRWLLDVQKVLRISSGSSYAPCRNIKPILTRSLSCQILSRGGVVWLLEFRGSAGVGGLTAANSPALWMMRWLRTQC